MQVSFLREQFAIWFDMIVNLFDRASTGTKTRIAWCYGKRDKDAMKISGCIL